MYKRQGEELASKRLQLLKEVLPKTTRVAIIWDRNSLASVSDVKTSETAARALGVQLQSIDVADADALDNAFQAAVKGRAQALVIPTSGFMSDLRKRIMNLAAKARLPAIYSQPQFTLAGGLMSYSADYVEQYRGAATHVAKILKGVKPADIPVQQPTLFEFVINMKTAKALGIKFSNAILVQATKVIP